MNYWLVKTEPETFSWDDLIKKGSSMWDGVRNFQARNNLRKMKTNDTLLFYHSGKNPGIVAIAKVVREHYPDPTAKEGDWSVVDVEPVRQLKRFISLQEVKQVPELSEMVLLKASRLSVQPVTKEEYNAILELEKS
ncbi:MAG TPA: EVE domain-containing protein [Bacteroidales bacterium]|nr:EVE domain-containing protein [Bacteroidales bacterium]